VKTSIPQENSVGDAQEKFQEGLKHEQSGSFSLAIESYKDAANQGDIKSQVKLSLMYSIGIGTPKDLKQAKLWADKAVHQNEKKAIEYQDMYAQEFTKNLPPEDLQKILKSLLINR
jgi:TPR repeat protein